LRHEANIIAAQLYLFQKLKVSLMMFETLICYKICDNHAEQGSTTCGRGLRKKFVAVHM